MVHASSSSEVSEKLKEAIKNPPNCLKYYAHPEEEEEEQEQQLVTPQDIARQRWKILCLVKTSDTVADETIRKEKIRERVDEWMSKMVSKMKMVEEASSDKKDPDFNQDQGSSSGRSSPMSSDYKASLEEIKRQTQREQLRRIRQREQVEREKERLMVLEGKIAFRPEHMQDPLLKIHSQFLQMEKQAKEHQARKLRKKERKAKAKIIKMKWTTAKDKLKLNNFNMFDHDNTVVANLLYDEKHDKLSGSSLLLDGNDEQDKKDDFVHPNPVFQAFDGATGVDDLYRIAEIYVNPASYYEFWLENMKIRNFLN